MSTEDNRQDLPDELDTPDKPRTRQMINSYAQPLPPA